MTLDQEIDDSEDHEYAAIALQILKNSQSLEFALKICISASYAIIKSKLDGLFPFKYDFKHVENFPLEKLLAIFKMINDNAPLQRRLNGLKEFRNYAAHNALNHRHRVFRELLDVDLTVKKAELVQANIEFSEVLKELSVEMNALLRLTDELNQA